jgi:hypothetical protein
MSHNRHPVDGALVGAAGSLWPCPNIGYHYFLAWTNKQPLPKNILPFQVLLIYKFFFQFFFKKCGNQPFLKKKFP